MRSPVLLFCTLFLGLAQADDSAPSYDLVVVGGTPGGIACAVREGLSVLLVNRHDHLGGISSPTSAIAAGHEMRPS